MAIDTQEPATPPQRPVNVAERAGSRSATAPEQELAKILEGALPAARRAAIVAQLGASPTWPTESEPPPSDLPERVGRYVIRRRLGAGGMGVVYEAEDPHLDRRIAIKVVRPDQLDREARARLLREARALARISHPNVVTVHDVGEHDGQVFVATELVDGETMATWQLGRDWRVVVDAWIQVARALAVVHAGGIVHRDVKPSNVFVGRDGRVRIGDFGIARGHAAATPGTPVQQPASVGQLTTTGTVAGTPGYIAPEQWRGAVDARSDQFALCVATIEGLTGVRPEAGQSPPILHAPPALRDVLIRGLAVDPNARFATMTALADALVQARALEPAPPRAPPRRRLASTVGWLVTGAMLFGGVAVLLYAALGERTAATAEVPVAAANRPPPAAMPAPDRSSAVDAVTPGPSDDIDVERRHRERPPTRVAASKRVAVAPLGDGDHAAVAALAKQAEALEAAGKWSEARALYQRLAKVKGYAGEAAYHQALDAFQMTAYSEAQELARDAGRHPAFRSRALLLYGDTIFQQGDIRRAKEFYLHLRKQLVGTEKEIATRKVVACNQALKLPALDGVTD